MDNEVKNINGVSEEQEALMARAKKMLELLKEEPEMKLVPFLRVTENGIRPDVRLVVTEKANESVASDEGTSGSEDSASEGESGSEQSTEPSNTAG